MTYNSFFEIMNSMALRQEMELHTCDFRLVNGVVKTISVTDEVHRFLIAYIDIYDDLKQVYVWVH